jgi:hypothetical protein
MSAAAVATISIVAAVLLAIAFGPDLLAIARGRSARGLRRPVRAPRHHVPDPGRELRAERRAEQLLLSVLGQDAYEAYRALGFLHTYGPDDGDEGPAYGYLIYPHKPIVSYDVRSGEPLSEHCVAFPDRTGGEFGERLPDADDVLAKWMALRGDERGLIRAANMHLLGRQLDPGHVRRDLVRLSEWTGRGAPAGIR